MSQQINFYQPQFRPKGVSLTSANAMLCGAGIAVAFAALAAVYEGYQLREVRERAQAVDSAFRAATAGRDKLAAELGKQKPNPQIETAVALLDAQLKGRQEIMASLKSGVVGDTGGFSEYLRAFSRQSVDGLWLTGFDIASAGNELAIQGRALSADLVATYLRQLNQEPAMQGRKLAALRINQAQPGVAPPDAPNAPKDGLNASGQTSPQPRKSVSPRYLDFAISTVESAEIPLGVKAVPEPPPLLGAIDTAAVLDPAKNRTRQEAAR